MSIAEVFLGLDDAGHWLRTIARLATAILLGGLVGFEREGQGKAAGLRTHMLVALGACTFMLVSLRRVSEGIN
jgi:putative Mg2+ transporter-C (MgtC) family protein